MPNMWFSQKRSGCRSDKSTTKHATSTTACLAEPFHEHGTGIFDTQLSFRLYEQLAHCAPPEKKRSTSQQMPVDRQQNTPPTSTPQGLVGRKKGLVESRQRGGTVYPAPCSVGCLVAIKYGPLLSGDCRTLYNDGTLRDNRARIKGVVM